MKKLVAALSAVLLCVAPAMAQETKEPTEQQKRMQSCNAEAKKRTFKGNDERQAFMSACLKGESPPEQAKVTPQQQRMKDCNAQAANQQFPSGRERQAFMTNCLRGN